MLEGVESRLWKRGFVWALFVLELVRVWCCGSWHHCRLRVTRALCWYWDDEFQSDSYVMWRINQLQSIRLYEWTGRGWGRSEIGVIHSLHLSTLLDVYRAGSVCSAPKLVTDFTEIWYPWGDSLCFQYSQKYLLHYLPFYLVLFTPFMLLGAHRILWSCL